MKGKFERKSLKADVPSKGMADGDTESTLMSPEIGTKEINSNEAFKFGPVISEYTETKSTDDSNKTGDSVVTEKVSVFEM